LRPGQRNFFRTICLAIAALSLVSSASLAQQPSPSLRAKSADAAQIAARLAQGPVRVIVRHQRPTTTAWTALGSRGESIAAVARDLVDLQDRLLARHFGAAGPGPARALRRMQVTPAFAVTATAAEVESMANDSSVVSITLDQIRRPVLTQSVPLIGMTNAYATYGATGSGWAVAIIDSGVDKTHTFLANVIAEACYSTTTGTLGSGGSASTCPGGASSSTAAGSGVNCNIAWGGCEHGTHVAGIAAGSNTQFQSGQPPNGVARAAGIIAIKAASEFSGADCSPGRSPCIAFWDSDMMAALDHVYAIRNSLPAGYAGVASANLSIGGGLFSSACDSSFPAFKTSIDNLLSANIATVIAAGNDGKTSQISFPACISSAIAIAASSKSDRVASYSNIDAQVALLAPGGDYNGTAASLILSSTPAGYAFCGSDGIAYSGPNPSTGGSYCYLEGTSMATPHVAGVFAAIRSAVPSATVAQILNALKSTGVAITDTRSGGFITKPRIRVDLALQALGAAVSTLQVSPASDMATTGNPGGPFSPSGFSYAISSSGGSVGYSVSGVPSWLTASATSGTATASPTTLTFTVNASANALAPGTYPATISFTNTTNGQGNLNLSATLTVKPPSVLQVSLATDMSASGTQGGPFAPSSFQYVLSATNGPVNFSISGLPAWLTASQALGSADVGTTVTFSVNASAAGLAPGTYTATVSFANTTNGQGNQTRSATLVVNPPSGVLPGEPRVFVAAQGSDANPCTFTLPCRTFQHAHDVVPAGGEIDVLDPAGYGAVSITKAVSIRGHGFADISVASGAFGITVNAAANDAVSLEGILLDGSGVGASGIIFGGGSSLAISNCVVRKMAAVGLSFGPTSAQPQTLSVSKSSFTENGAAGISIQPGGSGGVTAAIDRTRLYANGTAGVAVNGSVGTGPIKIVVTDSVASNTGSAGFVVGSTQSATSLALTRVLASGNGTGIQASGANATLRLARSTVTGNTTGFAAISSGAILSYGDNYIDANGGNIGALGSAPPQ
jgi:subtilisin family serine protease